MTYTLDTIGIVHSCFKEGFAVPRQPGLAPSARAELELLPPYNDPQAVEGLEQCSHIWLQFVFHRELPMQWQPRVRPPRLGGNRSLGVFATRSPRRPNALGLSVVRLEAVVWRAGKPWLQLSGIDLIDGTPVVDIKPYVPYADAVLDAVNRIAPAPPAPLPVSFAPQAAAVCAQVADLDLASLIREVLQQDPRPAYQTPNPERRYGTRLLDWELGWYYQLAQGGTYHIQVSDITQVSDTPN